MMNTFWYRGPRLWVQGLLLFALRLAQLRTGFDSETGLAVASLPGTLLAALLAVCAAAELVLCLRLPGEKAAFDVQFARPERAVPCLVAGSFLLAAGGALLLVSALPARGVAAMAAGILAVAAAGGFLLLVRQLRAGGTAGVLPLLPAMFFAVFFVLTVYLPAGADPVLARYYLPVLAASAAAYALSQLAGFLRRESSARSFVWTADCAVILCLAAMADSLSSPGLLLLYAGCALLLSVFLLLRREGPQEAAP
ncbi:MAG: hypothetical protein HFF81_03590 [Oscillospiraceae bacterium]|jgi:hypothetical protein|nr:hypothetical protein [Oscillospiraceae bacterium]